MGTCSHDFLPELTGVPLVAHCQYCGEKQILENPEDRFRMMEWISVKDRRPHGHAMVLMAAKTSMAGYHSVIYGYRDFSTGEWMYQDASGWNMVRWTTADHSDPVTHWMPMPKLPKEIG